MAAPQILNAAVTVTANASGAATATIGPDSGRGPARWSVTTVGVRNELAARRGQPPIPACNVYQDEESAANWLSGTYDGSFDVDSEVRVELGRGQVIVAVWAGAQSGDRLTLSVTGTKEGV